jgi:hypothetical protein
MAAINRNTLICALCTLAFLHILLRVVYFYFQVSRGHLKPQISKSNRKNEEKPISYIGFNESRSKLEDFITSLNATNHSVSYRFLVVFHFGQASNSKIVKVVENNIKIFVGSIEKLVNGASSRVQVFYWFNIVEGSHNAMYHHIPVSYPNVGVVSWSSSPGDMTIHLHTAKALSGLISEGIDTVVFLNEGVRGPLTHRSNGDWLRQYQQLLSRNNVGLVGSTISCEMEPHVQTHIFAIRTSTLPILLDLQTERSASTDWAAYIAQTEIGLSKRYLRSGYNISSMLYHNRLHKPYFDGQCIPVPHSHIQSDLLNPTKWCDVVPAEVMFVKWGGQPMKTSGYMCPDMVSRMQHQLLSLSVSDPGLGLIVPETIHGGHLHNLYVQYGLEMWRDFLMSKNKSVRAVEFTGKDKVCLLVRTCFKHDPTAQSGNINNAAAMDINWLSKCEY